MAGTIYLYGPSSDKLEASLGRELLSSIRGGWGFPPPNDLPGRYAQLDGVLYEGGVTTRILGHGVSLRRCEGSPRVTSAGDSNSGGYPRWLGSQVLGTLESDGRFGIMPQRLTMAVENQPDELEKYLNLIDMIQEKYAEGAGPICLAYVLKAGLHLRLPFFCTIKQVPVFIDANDFADYHL